MPLVNAEKNPRDSIAGQVYSDLPHAFVEMPTYWESQRPPVFDGLDGGADLVSVVLVEFIPQPIAHRLRAGPGLPEGRRESLEYRARVGMYQK